MVLLIAGTVAQRWVGLYPAVKFFLGSWIIWLGPLPLPGAYSILFLLGLCLLMKLALASPWRRQKIGILITHLSVVILLFGGLITSLHRSEGYIILDQGQTSATVQDYRLRELVIEKNGNIVQTVPQEQLLPGQTLLVDDLSIKIEKYCEDCRAIPRSSDTAGLEGLAAKVDIEPMTRKPGDETLNFAALLFSLQDKTYLLYQPMPVPVQIESGNAYWTLFLRPSERVLPFSVTLKNFQKTDYPGTIMAQEYSSDVSVQDGAVQWRETISMNQPLRTHGHTLYQSSYIENADGSLSSVFAVVKDAGQIFPYVSITLLCVGLLLHLVITMQGRRS